MPIKEENRSRYPDNWKEISRKVLARADNKYEFCGVSNYSIGNRDQSGRFYELDNSLASDVFAEENDIKVIKIVLTIAHLCHDESCCNMLHLRALCQRCHLLYDLPHHIRNAASTRRNRKAVGDLFDG
jgi:hypothetical protein